MEAGIYHPLPFWNKDNWRNRNRKEWTDEEKSQLLIDHFGSDGYEPANYKVCLIEFDPTDRTYFLDENGEKQYMKDVDLDVRTTWHVGQIVAMGINAFSSDRFPTGAIASYGDFVQFEGSAAQRIRFMNYPMVVIDDTNIVALLRDPEETING